MNIHTHTRKLREGKKIIWIMVMSEKKTQKKKKKNETKKQTKTKTKHTQKRGDALNDSYINRKWV